MAKANVKGAKVKKAKDKNAEDKKSKAVKVRRTPAAAAKAPRKAAAALALPATGPVTLEEARALARQAKGPAGMADVQVPRATAASVGEERQKLAKEHAQDVARRVGDYKATMSVMKKRGARRAKAPPGVEAAPSFAPLQVLAEGDSWFDYPAPFFDGGIIPRLENRLGVPILSLAKAGDEVRYMLGVEERILLGKHLREGCPVGGEWDALLFSGGGNDIVHNPMALWIKDYDPAGSPADQINQPRFTAALALVRAGYEDLISLRNALSPSTQLVFHGYDFALPDGRGVCFYGPWLKPTFTLRKFPTQDAAFEVVKVMLQQFAATLTSLAANPGVTVIDTQGALPAQKSSWHNELHPSNKGFNVFVDRFYTRIKELFPTRVV